MSNSPPDSQDSLPGHDIPAPEQNVASVSLLNNAWERQRVYSKNATSAQDRFLAVERLLTLLALLVVVLAVAQPVVLSRIGSDASTTDRMPLDLLFSPNPADRHVLLGSLNLLLIIIPITMAALRAFAVKFSRGNSWLLLRGSAEAIKMEIFCFRTQVKQYQSNRNTELAAKIQLISERLKGSVVHQRALFPYEDQTETKIRLGLLLRLVKHLGIWINRLITSVWEFLFGFKEEVKSLPQDPDRNADLDPDGYIKYRLEGQFDWYRRKARSQDRQHQILQTSVYAFGGIGTLLAAIGFQSWVAVTATLAAALVNYLEYRRVEATLMGYNQAADTLYDIRTWWLSLPEADKANFKNFEKLVVNTEETIRSEHNSWLQDMQDRLANLYDADSKGDAPAADGKPVDGSGPGPGPASSPETKPGLPKPAALSPDPEAVSGQEVSVKEPDSAVEPSLP